MCAGSGEKLLLAAMMLAFAGAVEQNILSLNVNRSAAATALYLESFLKEMNIGLE